MQTLVRTNAAKRVLGVALFIACAGVFARAQSTDIAWPSPVRTNEVQGTIAARDIGDPRVTDHFYAFTGTPGDVLITVEGRNLNGDVDVFTLSGLQPLLKFTVYAGSSSPITKGIYLRKTEELILRIEGRTPNDDDAVYRIHFGGAFEPITSGPLAEHEDANQPGTTVASGSSGKGGRRVSSVGARIAEPVTEVAETPKPEAKELPPVESSKAKTASTKTARNPRTRRPAPRRTRPTEPPKPAETAEKADNENKPPAENPENEVKTPAKVRRPTRRTATARDVPKPPATQGPEESGPRLLIETNDGTLVDRYMSSVRRVTVENGQVVVVGKDGKIQRIPLANVVRMTIAP
jgi:hypothetical protein